MQAQLSQVPVPPSDAAPGVPREVSSVVMKSLAKAPERFQTAVEFQAALRQSILGLTKRGDSVAVSGAEAGGRTGAAGDTPSGIRGSYRKSLGGESRAAAFSLTSLAGELAEQIPGEAERLGHLAFGLASGSQPAHPQSTTQSTPLDARTLEAARAALAAYLGPMSHACEPGRAARQFGGPVKSRTRRGIPDEQARRTFLASF